MFRCLWELGLIEKKQARIAEALTIWTDLAQSKNPYRADSLVELAKYYEHTEKNLFMALECASEALNWHRSVELLHRQERLHRKIAASRAGRLL
jgi:hypothetical protein